MPTPRLLTLAASAAALAALTLLGACSMVPAYRPPAMPMPATWSSRQPEPPTTGATASTESATWWTSFGSAELDALVARGLASGFDLQIAIHRFEQARARAGMVSAARYPTLGIGADASRGSSASTAKRSVSLQASYALDLWGLQRAQAASAHSTAESSRLDAEVARATLVASIANTYFQALSLDERLRLAELIAKDAQDMLALVETQVRFGAASQLEVAQQRNALQTFRSAVPLLRQQRDQATGDLAVLIGDIPENLHLAGRSLRDLRLPDVVASTPAEAIARLPEVRSAEAKLKAANFDIGAARAAFLPSVSLSAALGSTLNPSAAVWSLAGSALQPLFDAGQRQDQLSVDRAHAEELAATYRKSIATALQAIETQRGDVAAAREAEQLDTAAVESARSARDLARVRMTNGAIDFLTVLLSERTLYQAEDTALQVRLQRLQSTTGLFRALGTGQPLPTFTSTANQLASAGKDSP